MHRGWLYHWLTRTIEGKATASHQSCGFHGATGSSQTAGDAQRRRPMTGHQGISGFRDDVRVITQLALVELQVVTRLENRHTSGLDLSDKMHKARGSRELGDIWVQGLFTLVRSLEFRGNKLDWGRITKRQGMTNSIFRWWLMLGCGRQSHVAMRG